MQDPPLPPAGPSPSPKFHLSQRAFVCHTKPNHFHHITGDESEVAIVIGYTGKDVLQIRFPRSGELKDVQEKALIRIPDLLLQEKLWNLTDLKQLIPLTASFDHNDTNETLMCQVSGTTNEFIFQALHQVAGPEASPHVETVLRMREHLQRQADRELVPQQTVGNPTTGVSGNLRQRNDGDASAVRVRGGVTSIDDPPPFSMMVKDARTVLDFNGTTRPQNSRAPAIPQRRYSNPATAGPYLGRVVGGRSEIFATTRRPLDFDFITGVWSNRAAVDNASDSLSLQHAGAGSYANSAVNPQTLPPTARPRSAYDNQRSARRQRSAQRSDTTQHANTVGAPIDLEAMKRAGMDQGTIATARWKLAMRNAKIAYDAGNMALPQSLQAAPGLRSPYVNIGAPHAQAGSNVGSARTQNHVQGSYDPSTLGLGGGPLDQG